MPTHSGLPTKIRRTSAAAKNISTRKQTTFPLSQSWCGFRPAASPKKSNIQIAGGLRNGNDANNSTHYPYPSIDRGSANMAIQRWLGLLSKRRARLYPDNLTNSRFAGTNLAPRANNQLAPELTFCAATAFFNALADSSLPPRYPA